jgi:uncharacterized LabA/DUF88 family protein
MYKHPEQRVGVFIDTANMYHSAKNLFGDNVNFGNILTEAVGGRRLLRAIAYAINSKSEEENAFFDALEKQGFEVKQKDLQIFSSGMKKADWDVGIAMDAIKMADRLDAVVIVSGDGDFIPLVTYLQESKGCLVEVAAFGETTSSRLIEHADEFLNLSDDLGKFLIGSKKRGRKPLKSGVVSRARSAKGGAKKKNKLTF